MEHSKVWSSLLAAGGIVFAFGIIWAAFLLAQRFAEATGALVLIVVGAILLILAETVGISSKK